MCGSFLNTPQCSSEISKVIVQSTDNNLCHDKLQKRWQSQSSGIIGRFAAALEAMPFFSPWHVVRLLYDSSRARVSE